MDGKPQQKPNQIHTRRFDAGSKLSPRCNQVIDLLAAGLSEKEIAAEMHVSKHTVHSYVKEIYTQLGVVSRGELLGRIIDRQAKAIETLAALWLLALQHDHVQAVAMHSSAGGANNRPDDSELKPLARMPCNILSRWKIGSPLMSNSQGNS